MPVTSLPLYGFAFNGYAFGGAGSVHQILSVEGLEALPQIRNQDDNRGYFDGMFSGNDFLAGRTITLTINTFAGNGNNAQVNYNLLQANLLPQTSGTGLLQFQMDVSHPLQFTNARVRVNATSVDPDYTYGFIKSQYSFFCPDPRYYDNTLNTASITISTSLGRTYNRVYPLTYGGGSSAITTDVTNSGWATTYPTITVNGPINNPTVGNLTQGDYITINGSYTNTDVITVDLDSKLITVNGVSARNLLAGNSTWFSAQVGTNLFYLTGTGTLAGTSSASVSWYNAYI